MLKVTSLNIRITSVIDIFGHQNIWSCCTVGTPIKILYFELYGKGMNQRTNIPECIHAFKVEDFVK